MKKAYGCIRWGSRDREASKAQRRVMEVEIAVMVVSMVSYGLAHASVDFGLGWFFGWVLAFPTPGGIALRG
ncbi:hypothetical protein D8674_036355 [Pyrus ussuriensis x Pyrus communis]|uniref:Uncharacterized protein n=1 Tax=Pyrus ussuriensis x Pyrus communis TaxID=2448454 RepID=A0A5N5GEW1_9ROSA|nr:hypothetical protein D8674_036355 [Pyrus ussuriensis x Pyrus communis]